MRRCTSAPKPSERLLVYSSGDVVACVRGAVAVLYAVEAGEVGRSLCGGQNVVARQCVLYERQRDLEYLRAQRLVRLGSRHDVLADRVRDALTEILLRQTDLEALDVSIQVCAQGALERGLDRGGVMQRVVAGNGVEQHRSVLDGGRTDRSGRGRMRTRSDRNGKPRRRSAWADNAAEGRRRRMEPPVSEAEGGASPAATTAAEPPDEPPGTRSRPCGLCVGCAAEFSQEEPIANSSMFAFAGDNSVSSGQLLDDGRVVRRIEVIKHLGRAGGQRALGADIVLDGDRDAGQSGKAYRLLRASCQQPLPARVLLPRLR